MLKNIRVKEILAYFEDAGIKSVFIVCLTSFLIGIVLAYQGSNLLERFGATIIIVEMMGLLTLREITPLVDDRRLDEDVEKVVRLLKTTELFE